MSNTNPPSSSNSNNPNNTSNRISILDRPLSKKHDSSVSLSMFGYLYSELLQYHQNRVDSIVELERRLEQTGFGMGLKLLEYISYKHNKTRETKLMGILQFISTIVWKQLFRKTADSLEKSIDHDDEFMIVEYLPISSLFISVPSDFGGLSPDAYLSGMIAGILEGAGFPSRVTAHTVQLEEGEATPQPRLDEYLPARQEKTVFLVKFAQSVLERDTNL